MLPENVKQEIFYFCTFEKGEVKLEIKNGEVKYTGTTGFANLSDAVRALADCYEHLRDIGIIKVDK